MSRAVTSRDSDPRFAVLEPRVKQVSKAAIKKRWKRLPDNAQDNIRRLLLALEQQSKTTDRSKRKAATAPSEIHVDRVVERLVERLPRMPFPPSTIDDHFDFETTLDKTRNVEEQLTSNQHSINLLRAQITQEEKMLVQDQQELAQLAGNMRSSDKMRNQQFKKLHLLAQVLKSEGDGYGMAQTIPKLHSDCHTESVDHQILSEEPSVAVLLDQLRNHLDSMQNNIIPLQSIEAAMLESHDALNKLRSRMVHQASLQFG